MQLIIQGADVETGDLKQIAKLVGANAIEQIAPNVFRLSPTVPREAPEKAVAPAKAGAKEINDLDGSTIHSIPAFAEMTPSKMTPSKMTPSKMTASGMTASGMTGSGMTGNVLSQTFPSAELESLCTAARLDYAWVAPFPRWADIGLVAMDMDSTLITIECIDEIADMLNLKAQVASVTEAAMRGEIDFAESLKQRVALLAGLDENALQRVYDERLKLTPGAETLLTQLQAHGIKTLLVSGGFTFFTERLKQRLRLDYAASNTLEIMNGKLTGKVLGTIVDAEGKAAHLRRLRDELGLGADQTLAIGDGANDLKMLSAAAIGVAFHAKPIVRAQTTHAINYGGLDAVWYLLND